MSARIPESCVAKGNELFQGGKSVGTFDSHKDAVEAAQGMIDGAKSRATVRATAFAEIALNFEKASDFVTIVDVDTARASDLAAESDESVIKALMRRKPADVVVAHQQSVRAMAVDRPFTFKGNQFLEGDFVVLNSDGGVEAHSAEDFAKLFKAS